MWRARRGVVVKHKMKITKEKKEEKKKIVVSKQVSRYTKRENIIIEGGNVKRVYTYYYAIIQRCSDSGCCLRRVNMCWMRPRGTRSISVRNNNNIAPARWSYTSRIIFIHIRTRKIIMYEYDLDDIVVTWFAYCTNVEWQRQRGGDVFILRLNISQPEKKESIS